MWDGSAIQPRLEAGGRVMPKLQGKGVGGRWNQHGHRRPRGPIRKNRFMHAFHSIDENASSNAICQELGLIAR